MGIGALSGSSGPRSPPAREVWIEIVVAGDADAINEVTSRTGGVD